MLETKFQKYPGTAWRCTHYQPTSFGVLDLHNDQFGVLIRVKWVGSSAFHTAAPTAANIARNPTDRSRSWFEEYLTWDAVEVKKVWRTTISWYSDFLP